MSLPIALGDEYAEGRRPECPHCGALLHDRHRCNSNEDQERDQ